MGQPIYMGDEISAAGWRLAGVHTVVPGAGDEAAALARSCELSPLVLVSAAVAQHIDETTLRRAIAALSPLVLVVPDPQGVATVPDLAARLRTQLGLEA